MHCWLRWLSDGRNFRDQLWRGLQVKGTPKGALCQHRYKLFVAEFWRNIYFSILLCTKSSKDVRSQTWVVVFDVCDYLYQDTCVALQALSKYSEKTAGAHLDLRVSVSSEKQAEWKRRYHIDMENALSLRQEDVSLWKEFLAFIRGWLICVWKQHLLSSSNPQTRA